MLLLLLLRLLLILLTLTFCHFSLVFILCEKSSLNFVLFDQEIDMIVYAKKKKKRKERKANMKGENLA